MKDSTTILTIEELKEFTAIVKTVDPELLEPFLESAESMHVEPVLGTALYDELIGEIEEGNLSENNETLVANYILPFSAWYCFYDSSLFVAFKTTNKGILRQSSDNSDPVDTDELRMFRQGIIEKASHYRNRCIKYLEDNSSLYPNYRAEGECNNSRRSNPSGFFMG